eukprot:c44731_g1_i1 orf=24-266(+)
MAVSSRLGFMKLSKGRSQALIGMKHGNPCVGMERQMKNVKDIHYKSQQEDEEADVSIGNHKKSEEDVTYVALLKACAKQK